MRIFANDQLQSAPLIIDAVYEGTNFRNSADDPLSKLLPGIGNQGGFRAAGRGDDKQFVVLYTSGENRDWPDKLDPNTGQFIYYGDNRGPGQEIHDTPKRGNMILSRVFSFLHASPAQRSRIPPFFIFQRHPTPDSPRAVQFKGLAAPGFPGLPPTEDLVAIWKSAEGQRFQNYRSIFTVLDVPVVDRQWIDALGAKETAEDAAPSRWREFVGRGRYHPLTAEPTTVIRSMEDQLPKTNNERKILTTVWRYFKDAPTSFEPFAARVFQMLDQRVVIDSITRASVDGGRDAFGRYLLGLASDPVYAEFSLEAKCFAPPSSESAGTTVGVKEVSRLISRIRHREFGVLVTTSIVARQAYEEVRKDKHPIVFISGRDIAEVLVRTGYNSPSSVESFLLAEFPRTATDLLAAAKDS